MRRCFSCACLVALLTGVVHADDVLLKGGARISGRILSRTATTVEVDVGAGIVTIPMSSVERIDERRSPLVEYHERAAPLGDADSNGWLQLATWATGQGLGAQARTAYEKVVSVDPAHAEANQALGRVQLDGRWVTEEESYRARGYVRFEGEWTPAAERDAILGFRAADAERVASLDAERRVREAEARAREAETRARHAEATVPGNAGFLLWWGGWGPAVWPSPPPGAPPPPRTTPADPLPSLYPSQPLLTPLPPLVPPPPSASPSPPPGGRAPGAGGPPREHR
jgi:hypothetical protein